jgi:hypothetical protein
MCCQLLVAGAVALDSFLPCTIPLEAALFLLT